MINLMHRAAELVHARCCAGGSFSNLDGELAVVDGEVLAARAIFESHKFSW